VSKAPCAELAELRSAYVDGALSDADREKLLNHLLDCSQCRADVAELRAVRELLSRTRADDDWAAPDLSARLVLIAGSEAREPLWTRPFRRSAVAAGATLPSRRRARRVRRTAAVAATLGTVTAAGFLGYATAPSARLAVVSDQTDRAQAAFSSSVGQFPLASEALGAVMLADASELAAAPAALEPGPSSAFGASLSAAEAKAVMQRAAQSEHTVNYSGRQAFFASRGDRTMRAVIEVEARTGQGSQVNVLSTTGQQLLQGFTPAALSSRVVDDELLALLERNYTLTGTQGATVAGRSATVVAAWRGGEPAARWWLDDQTGIVLWQELYGQSGAIDLSFGFTSVVVTSTAGIMDHLPPRLLAPTTTISLSVANTAALAAAGWACPEDLSGMSVVRLRTDRAADPTVLLLVYSDGVATVGVFEQRGRLGGGPAESSWDPDLRAYAHHGPSQVATWQSKDLVFTVVTNGPSDVLSRAVGSLPHEQAEPPTTIDRIKEGWVTILAGLKG
jgi:negative regulator of sigma E activity